MNIGEIIKESVDPKVIDTSQHMVKQYNKLSYTPYDRAIDHATSYESNTPQYKYWMNVAQEILKIEKTR